MELKERDSLGGWTAQVSKHLSGGDTKKGISQF